MEDSTKKPSLGGAGAPNQDLRAQSTWEQRQGHPEQGGFSDSLKQNGHSVLILTACY